MASHSGDVDRVVNTPATNVAVQKLLAGIEDPQVDSRYPNQAHLIPADHPQQALMTSRALFQGEPVVLVYLTGAKSSSRRSAPGASSLSAYL